MKSMSWRTAAFFAAAFFIAWCLFVNRSGIGDYWIPGEWDFTLTGQLGDSFGVVSALSATLAAVFAYKAATDAVRESNRLRMREARRDAEATFFRLLDHRFKIAEDLTFETSTNIYTGLHAADKMVEHIRTSAKQSGKSYRQEFAYLYRRNRHELAHYFRFTYHIIKFVDENCDEDVSYKLATILRAQLSMPEQVLIALNALSSNGREKMKPLIEKYALMHSLPKVVRKQYKLAESGMGAGAFDRPVEGPPER